MAESAKTHIEVTPGTCGGKPRIADTRIRVQDIVIWTEQGETPDDIVSGYPHLTLADVHAALAYYYDYQEDIDRQIAESAQFIADMEAQQRSKMHTHTDADTLPS